MTDEEAKKIILSTRAASDKLGETIMEAYTGIYKRVEKVSGPDAVFWAYCKTEKTLKAPLFRKRIERALSECDVEFFKKLGTDLKRKPPEFPWTEFFLIVSWERSFFGHGLCVCSDQAIADWFKFLGNGAPGTPIETSHTLTSMRKLRQRLGLVKPKKILFRRFIVRGGLCGFE